MVKHVNLCPAESGYILFRNSVDPDQLASVFTVFHAASESNAFIESTLLNWLEIRSECAILIFSAGQGLFGSLK